MQFHGWGLEGLESSRVGSGHSDSARPGPRAVIRTLESPFFVCSLRVQLQAQPNIYFIFVCFCDNFRTFHVNPFFFFSRRSRGKGRQHSQRSFGTSRGQRHRPSLLPSLSWRLSFSLPRYLSRRLPGVLAVFYFLHARIGSDISLCSSFFVEKIINKTSSRAGGARVTSVPLIYKTRRCYVFIVNASPIV